MLVDVTLDPDADAVEEVAKDDDDLPTLTPPPTLTTIPTSAPIEDDCCRTSPTWETFSLDEATCVSVLTSRWAEVVVLSTVADAVETR
ncbi:hypothetical protein M407DRAFT_205652 [Tulasnella calospora MUT 4182]|uniref:Uncharacterized protein n=1 Tax=Tulasnella calospora MUT 4182 TaxID=1051891 RepID=A0A0C3Q093_9AGAM|nr:hypothetical protein M407DRAFT_205652 [Tulasnella calospora MUT 4182]